MDQYLWNALRWVLEHPSGSVLSLLAFLALIYRDRLRSLLSLDVEKFKADLQRDHAELLAKHQRELEAYKVALISEAEHVKAAKDIQKSIALKVAERRFDALAEMVDAMAGTASKVSTLATLKYPDEKSRAARIEVVRKIMERLDAADDRVRPFISLELRGAVLAYTQAIGERLTHAIDHPDQQLAKDDRRITSLLEQAVSIDGELRRLLLEFEKMGRE